MIRLLLLAALALLLVGCSSGVAGSGATGEDTKEAAWRSKPGAQGGAGGAKVPGSDAIHKKGG